MLVKRHVFTLNACRNGFLSFTSAASDTWPSPSPSEDGNISNTIISNGMVSNGSSKRAKNPGLSTAQT